MRTGEEIYHQVRDASDTAVALKALKPRHWVLLYGHLLRTYEENARTGEILGLMMVVGSDRYVQGLAKRGKVREVLG